MLLRIIFINIIKHISISFTRVKEGKVTLDGVNHQLSLNDFGTQFRHHLHGGNNSFDRSGSQGKAD